MSEPIKAYVERLRVPPGKGIWMMRGGEITASFLNDGETVEFSIHVIPITLVKSTAKRLFSTQGDLFW